MLTDFRCAAPPNTLHRSLAMHPYWTGLCFCACSCKVRRGAHPRAHCSRSRAHRVAQASTLSLSLSLSGVVVALRVVMALSSNDFKAFVFSELAEIRQEMAASARDENAQDRPGHGVHKLWRFERALQSLRRVRGSALRHTPQRATAGNPPNARAGGGVGGGPHVDARHVPALLRDAAPTEVAQLARVES